ncbi:hypothetical protein MNBD_GAMMA13-1779 [hydrothermal vent metagenome]|uniref:Uncharacterized protein n=1 Tax=hydrothermal vent metagenome TaxID=652676 RepID=A0A3B0Z716_9ZZZZ
MVEEDQYRSTYKRLNERRCVFEKAILSHRCNCNCSARFYLADREGIACDASEAHKRCEKLIRLLRENAKFALKLIHLDEDLPHGKEIKVQNGGLLGLQRILRPDLTTGNIVDISGLTALGERTYGSLEAFPFREIVKSIVNFVGRRKPVSKR